MSVTNTLVDFITARRSAPPDVARIVDLCLLDYRRKLTGNRIEGASQVA